MKVLYLIQKPQLRGAEVFASQLASHVINLGHNAIIVCVFNGDAELPFSNSLFFLNGNPNRRFRDFNAWKKLARIIKDYQPDIIQANAGDTLKYAVFSKIFFSWKQAIVFRNASTISLYIKTRYAKYLSSFFLSFADKIISVSKASASDFSLLFPRYKSKVLTIPIGIETSETEHDPRLYHKNQKDLFNQPGPVILHVGGFTFEKNHTGMVNIFQAVLKNIPNARLFLVGDGPLQEQIRQIVSQKDLDRQIIFLGMQKNVFQFIRQADVLILPSLIEGLPGVILEAFYCKTPVVAYDVGGIKEILVNNRTGRLIEKGDEKCFVNGVLQALNHSTSNDTLVENAHALVMSHYLNKKIASEFLNVYKEII